MSNDLIECCEKIQDWIVQSEMGLNSMRNSNGQHEELDETDTFHEAYRQLNFVIEKLEMEN